MKEFPLNDWEPQNQFLGIIGTGDGYAVASKGGVGIEGKYLWDLKDRIDRTWMQGYQLFPDVELMMKQKHIDYLKSLKQRSDSELELVELPQLAKNMGEETIKLLSKSKMRYFL